MKQFPRTPDITLTGSSPNWEEVLHKIMHTLSGVLHLFTITYGANPVLPVCSILRGILEEQVNIYSLEVILHAFDKQVTLIGCASRHSTCATACWLHSGNCAVLMTRLWMTATWYCSACSRPWKNSLNCDSVLSATAGLLGSDISSSGTWKF